MPEPKKSPNSERRGGEKRDGAERPLLKHTNAHKPAAWERVLAGVCAVGILTLVFIVVLRKEPFADQNQVVLVRIVLSLAVSIIGAVIPGFLQVDLSGKGLAIRAGGALALFVITFFFSPKVLPLGIKGEQLEKIEKNSAGTRSDVTRIISKFESIQVQAVYELPMEEPDVKTLETCLNEIYAAIKDNPNPHPKGLGLCYLGSEPSRPSLISIDLEEALNPEFANLCPKLGGLIPLITFLRQPRLQIGINRPKRATNDAVSSFLGLVDRPDLYLFVHGWPVDVQHGKFGQIISDISRGKVLVAWNGFNYPPDKWATSRKVVSIQDLDESQFVAMLTQSGNVEENVDRIAAKCVPSWVNLRFDNNFVTLENFEGAPATGHWQAFTATFPSARSILEGKASHPLGTCYLGGF